jgi:hypothetical protein
MLVFVEKFPSSSQSFETGKRFDDLVMILCAEMFYIPQR